MWEGEHVVRTSFAKHAYICRGNLKICPLHQKEATLNQQLTVHFLAHFPISLLVFFSGKRFLPVFAVQYQYTVRALKQGKPPQLTPVFRLRRDEI